MLQNRQPVVKIEVGNLLFPEQAKYIYIVVCQRGRPFNLIYWLGITQCNSPNFWEIKKLIVRFQHACDEYSCSTKWVCNFKETMEFEQFILWQLIKEILYYILKLKKIKQKFGLWATYFTESEIAFDWLIWCPTSSCSKQWPQSQSLHADIWLLNWRDTSGIYCTHFWHQVNAHRRMTVCIDSEAFPVSSPSFFHLCENNWSRIE